MQFAHCTCALQKCFFPSGERLGKKYQINPRLFCCHYLTNLLFNKIGIQFNSDFQRGTPFGYKTFMNFHSLKYHTNMQLISRDFSFTVLTPSSEVQSNLDLRNG